MTRAGDRNTQSHGGGEGGRGNPPTQPHCWGSEKRRDLFFLSGVFQGRGAVKWGQRPETSNMEGASGVAGVVGEDKGREEGEGWGGRRDTCQVLGLRCLVRKDGEERGHGTGGGQTRRKGLGRWGDNSGGRVMEGEEGKNGEGRPRIQSAPSAPAII